MSDRYRLPGPRLHMRDYRPVRRSGDVLATVLLTLIFGAIVVYPLMLAGYGWLR